MAWLVVSLRRLRVERTASIGLVVLVLVTALIVAIAPRAFVRLADGALRGEVATARSSDRNVALQEETRLAPSGPGGLDRGLDKNEARIPAAVRALFVDRSFVVDTPRFAVTDGSSTPSTVRFRFQSGAPDHVGIVAGRLPTGATRELQITPAGTEEKVTLTVLEVALSTESAAQIGAAAGDTLALEADSTDRLAFGHNDRVAVDVVGIFKVTDPAENYWLDDTSLDLPTTRDINANLSVVDATALLAPEAYAPLIAVTDSSSLPLRYAWRYFIDPDRLASGTLDALTVDLRRMESIFPRVATGLGQGGTILRSSLLRIVEAEGVRWRSAEVVLTVAAIGAATVAAAAVALGGLLVVARRRSAIALWRGRGASFAQVLGAALIEGFFLTVPAALAGGLLARALLPDGPDRATAVATGLLALATIAALLALTAPVAASRVNPASGQARSATIRRVGPRRIVAEGVVIILAVAGAILLRDRGVRGASSAGELAAADPLVAAVPALAGIAAGLIVVRLFPLPMRAFAALASFGRGLVPVLAMRRLTRGAGAAPILLVLLATGTIATFAAATFAHLGRAADLVAWHDVGAPYRLNGAAGPIPGGTDVHRVTGLEASAAAFRGTAALGASGAQVELLAVDTADYVDVVRGTPADPGLPPELLARATEPFPAIVSSTFGSGSGRIELGQVFQVSIGAKRVSLRAIEVRDTFATFDAGSRFAVVARDQLTAGGVTPTVTTIFARAPIENAAALRTEIHDAAPGVVLESRAEESAAIRDSPVARAVSVGAGFALLVAGAYAALAVASALALAGAARAVEVVHLRLLGMSRREALGLALVEHGPTVAIAFAVGVGLGLGLFIMVEPALGLQAIVGSDLPIPLAFGLGEIGLIMAAIVAISAVGIGIGAFVQERAVPASVVRQGLE
jgi:putative ABC transport system permease protein